MAEQESIYSNLKFLVVDDFPAMCKQIERILNSAGARHVDIVFNGENALLSCSREKYDVIFADFNLGAGKNGQQLLEELRHRKWLKSTCAYIMITAEATKDFVYGALEFQPDAYLNKPFNQAELLQRLQRIVLEKQAVSSILIAEEKGDMDKAIELCISGMQSDPKRRSFYLKMLSDLYLRVGKFDKAKGVFDQVLSVRPLDWAAIGKARALKELGEFDEAKAILEPMAAKNTPHMHVYDILAEIAEFKGDTASQQAILEHAVAVSPRSVKRQQSLAKVADNNNQFLVAENAYKHAMKSAEHSMHDGPDIYINYANSLNNAVAQIGTENGERFKESQRIIGKVKKKFRDPLVTMRLNMVNSAANKLNGNEKDAQELMAKVEQDYALLESQMGMSIGPESRLEFAHLLLLNNKQDQAQEVLRALAEDYPSDADLGKRIDKVSSEPYSQAGKAAAIALNKEGKALLEAKNYVDAITLFDKALNIFPNNIGLKLNFVLAQVQRMKVDGRDAEIVQRCQNLLLSIGEMDPQNPLFNLYNGLKQAL
jgi:DNA-binding response OmpR family regulator